MSYFIASYGPLDKKTAAPMWNRRFLIVIERVTFDGYFASELRAVRSVTNPSRRVSRSVRLAMRFFCS